MKTAAEYVKLSSANLELLNSEYVTFLEKVIAYHQKKNPDQFPEAEMFESQLLDQ
jgi:hypothetical protein